MDYKLYTLVDITHTGQHRHEPGLEHARLQEQNFNTVLQTLGLRSNISYTHGPQLTEVKGRLVGFETDEIIRVWRFDWRTERDHLYEVDSDPVYHLKNDFHLVPYIDKLDELMEQTYAVFAAHGSGVNIVFQVKQ